MNSSLLPLVPRTIATEVGPVQIRELGRGPAVLMRHGIFFDHTLWLDAARALSRRHRVVLVDAPGHGSSADRGTAYSLADDAKASLDILDALQIERAVLIGHSWGGMSAVRAALAAPERVSALALVDTPLEQSDALGRLRYRLLRLLLLAIGAPSWYGRQVAGAMFSDQSRAADPGLEIRLMRGLAGADRRALARAMDAVLVRPDRVIDRLGELRMPVLVLAGDEDYVLPPSTRDALERELPLAAVETVPGKHAVPWEAPGPVTARLETFLADVA
jgi:pimeloyl-ACP methyl ester carboxylesterase